MNQHTTNYQDTFIEVATDTKAVCGTKPPARADKMTIAFIQFNLIQDNPYKYTSDDVLFQVFVTRNQIKKSALKAAREDFFSKGQPCLRSSPLAKTYGFGIHADRYGKIALHGMETATYKRLASDPQLKQVNAMRSSKKIK